MKIQFRSLVVEEESVYIEYVEYVGTLPKLSVLQVPSEFFEVHAGPNNDLQEVIADIRTLIDSIVATSFRTDTIEEMGRA